MTMAVGRRKLPLTVFLTPGYDWTWSIQLRVGTSPSPWPTGTTADLKFTDRDGFVSVWSASVDGAFLRWSKPAAAVSTIPGAAYARLVLGWSGTLPFVWREGPVRFDGCGPGQDLVVTDLPFAEGVVAVDGGLPSTTPTGDIDGGVP